MREVRTKFLNKGKLHFFFGVVWNLVNEADTVLELLESLQVYKGNTFISYFYYIIQIQHNPCALE